MRYYLNEQGNGVYTLKKFDPMGQQTRSAHPAWFSPDDKYSRHRITIKKRFKQAIPAVVTRDIQKAVAAPYLFPWAINSFGIWKERTLSDICSRIRIHLLSDRKYISAHLDSPHGYQEEEERGGSTSHCVV
ncbi:hypothetical protein U0070_009213 [Myodes glareolus]|uniref:H/ACA ribonucleoprotein complex subunit 3 n=1 Tax=Myodes glareolus TaxID=447135 RepID=A0AAW0HGW1_MYOGA